MVKGNKSFLGRHHSERAIKNIKEKHIGEINPMWKGDMVGIVGVHSWVKRHKQKPEFCERCKKNKPFDLANISGEYKRDINDFEWLCRSCHMEDDGRLKQLMINHKPKQKLARIKLICLNCSKEFYVLPSKSNGRKNYSKKCSSEYRSKNKLFWGNQYHNPIKESKYKNIRR